MVVVPDHLLNFGVSSERTSLPAKALAPGDVVLARHNSSNQFFRARVSRVYGQGLRADIHWLRPHAGAENQGPNQYLCAEGCDDTAHNRGLCVATDFLRPGCLSDRSNGEFLDMLDFGEDGMNNLFKSNVETRPVSLLSTGMAEETAGHAFSNTTTACVTWPWCGGCLGAAPAPIEVNRSRAPRPLEPTSRMGEMPSENRSKKEPPPMGNIATDLCTFGKFGLSANVPRSSERDKGESPAGASRGKFNARPADFLADLLAEAASPSKGASPGKGITVGKGQEAFSGRRETEYL